MKNKVRNMILACAALMFAQCTPPTFKITFDGTKELSGNKFALKDINAELPTDWSSYNYVVLEYKISTAQRFQLGFTTDSGYNELRVMSYVPNAWNKLAIPLKYFTELPDAAVDLAATFNHARYMGWINLGGVRGPLTGVDSIGIRMRKAIGNPTFEIRNVTLSVDDPGDTYLEETPAIDEFGQSNLVDYPEKVHSLAELEEQWRAEENEEVSTAAYNYSKFGGYKQKQVKGTGFFRTELIGDRWWFVDPEGYLFLSVGIDCVGVGGGGNIRDVEHRAGMYKELPPADLMERFGKQGHRRTQQGSFGLWNQIRRHGDDFSIKSKELVIKRMDKWGLNTIANWSDNEIMAMNRKAFLFPLHGLGLAPDLMGLCDIYDPGFQSMIDKTLSETTKDLKTNPWLIGYFIGNEPAWLNEEVRLCDLILSGKDRPIKGVLEQYLAKNGDSEGTRKEFVYNAFRSFLIDVNKTLKKYDPNHLNLGIRFGDPDKLQPEILKICSETFDVFSFNCYQLAPNEAMLTRALEITGLPMIIGEYHFGTVDRGLAQSLWQVNSEAERGVAYRYYTEQAYAHPGLIGTGYFQWCDQDITGRGDGENYNCGLIDVTDRPYIPQVEAMSATARVLYNVHSASLAPYAQQPKDARGHEVIPNTWN